MRPVSAAVLCAVALLCSSRVAAVEYARPTNGDCLQPGGAGTPADAQLYPEQYMLVGDEQTQNGLSTQASGHLRGSRVLSVQPRQRGHGKRQIGGQIELMHCTEAPSRV